MLSFGDYNNKQTVRALETPPLPPLLRSAHVLLVQCCHNIGRSPSFAFVLWIHNGGHGALVDRILALWETQSSNAISQSSK